jgi:hypothetical protein
MIGRLFAPLFIADKNANQNATFLYNAATYKASRRLSNLLPAIACAVHFLTFYLTRNSLRLILIWPSLNWKSIFLQ